MKKINLIENQLKIIVEKIMLNEAMMDGFSTDELSKLPSFNAKLKYCKQMLGNYIGKGSSRIVFQIDDNKVLKLAYNDKGIAQNDAEGDWGAQRHNILPILFDVSDDGVFLISEYVLPAKLKDFPKCLGIDFEEFHEFVYYTSNLSKSPKNRMHCTMSKERYDELLDYNEWFDNFATYQGNFLLPVGDLCTIRNYGLTYRDSKPMIVLLDSGYSESVKNNFYS